MSNLKYATEYQPQDGDRILITCPRTGSALFAYIARCITSGGRVWEGRTPIDLAVHLLEAYGKRATDGRLPAHLTDPEPSQQQQQPRLIWTHMSDKLLANTSGAQYLLVLRNPKDVCVSLYHYQRQHMPDPELQFDRYCSQWLADESASVWGGGHYFRTMRLFWEHRQHPKCTVIVYEHIFDNDHGDNSGRRRCIEQIAWCFGPEYVSQLYDRCDYGCTGAGGSGEFHTLLDRIVEATDFNAMSAALGPNPLAVNIAPKYNTSRHLRRGRAGDWRSVMAIRESAAIDDRVRHEWSGIGLDVLWDKELKWN